jgi:RNA recognition motif-containing protein
MVNFVSAGKSVNLFTEKLREYFSKIGKVTETIHKRDPETKRPRGFGFVTFENQRSAARAVAAGSANIDNRMVLNYEPLPCLYYPKVDVKAFSQGMLTQTFMKKETSANFRSDKYAHKIFVGGVPTEAMEGSQFMSTSEFNSILSLRRPKAIF